MSKIKIGFDKRSYDKAEQAHNEYKEAKSNLEAIVKGLGLDKSLVKEERIYVSVVEALYDKLSEGSTLPAGINKLKFLGLMDVDLTDLSNAVNKFSALERFSAKPKKSDYDRYSDSENAERLMELVNFLNDNLDLIGNRALIKNGFSNKIGIDTATFKFKVNG